MEELVPGFTFKTTAVRDEKCLKHFGINEITASVYGHSVDKIMEVQMEVSKNQERPINDTSDTVDYWGYDFESKRFSLIYAKYFLLNICFPYGIETSEKVKQGRAYRLEQKLN